MNNFWASWRQPCRAEIPDLNEVFEEYGDQDLVVLGVNTAYTDSRADVLEFVDEIGLPITFLVDENGIIWFIKIDAA